MMPQLAWATGGTAVNVAELTEFKADSDTKTTTAFKISSAESLRALAAAVKDADGKGTYNMKGVTFYLAKDITLTSDWTPISAVKYPTDAFAGTFNGNGKTNSGLSIRAPENNQGLFGLINGATIKNLKVEGTVYSTGSYVGGIVGKVQTGTIENCGFGGSGSSVKSENGYAGGIVGGLTSTGVKISGCYNKASVTGNYAGGILGYCGKSAAIENCYNTGTISGFCWNRRTVKQWKY